MFFLFHFFLTLSCEFIFLYVKKILKFMSFCIKNRCQKSTSISRLSRIPAFPFQLMIYQYKNCTFGSSDCNKSKRTFSHAWEKHLFNPSSKIIPGVYRNARSLAYGFNIHILVAISNTKPIRSC